MYNEDAPQQPTGTGGEVAASLLRTVLPILIGFIITQALRLGVHIDATETDALTALISAAYYALVRIAETYVSAKFGWLLGLAKKPVYQS